MILDFVVGSIIGGAIGGAIWLVFFKILENPFEKVGNYLEKKGVGQSGKFLSADI